MTGKFTLKLEGDAYADGLTTADKFLTLITDRLDKIDRITDNILDLTNLNADALEDIRAAIKDLEEAKAAINTQVSTLFKSFYLQVKLGGIRYSALGEFRSPGKKVILQNQATIFEAIAASGDLTQVAKRDEIKLIRQYPDGTRIHTLNLLDQSIISSPYYFIQPNDVVYAEPLPQKAWGIGVTGAQTFTTIISTLSTSLALTLSIISLTR